MRLAVNTGSWKPSREEWEAALDLIAQCEPNEAARVSRFKMEEDRKRSLLGRILLRLACSRVLGIPFAKLRFERTSSNKPVCLDLKQGEVNISHHGAWVVLALEQTCEQVGVDVMRYDQPRNVQVFFHSMRHQFTQKEWEGIGTSLERFFQHWALKEALVKAMGIGLGFNLQRASFFIHEDHRIELELDGKRTEEWDFYLTALDDTHCAAVALFVSKKSAASTATTIINQAFSQVLVQDLLAEIIQGESLAI